MRKPGSKILQKSLQELATSACIVAIFCIGVSLPLLAIAESRGTDGTSGSANIDPSPTRTAPDLAIGTGTQSTGGAPAGAPPPVAGKPKKAQAAPDKSFACPVGVKPGTEQGNCTWYNSADPDAEPIQGITYDRANDTLGLMVEYSIAKLDRLKQEFNDGKHSEVVDALGEAFCPEQKAKGCLDRYERFVLLEANRLNNAVALNDTSNAALRSNLDTTTGKRQGVQVAVAARLASPDGKPAPSARPELPYLPSFDELNALRGAQFGKIQATFSSEYEKWLKQEYGKPPNCNDFPKFNKIPRNPDNESEGHFMVVARDPKDPSKALCNKESPEFKKAQAAYEHARVANGGLEMDQKDLLDAFKKASADKSKKKALTKGLDDTDKSQKLNNEIFKQTRDRNITNLNEQLGKHQKKAAKTPNRGTANSTKGKPETSGNIKLKPGTFTDHFILLNGDMKMQEATTDEMLQSKAIGEGKVSIGNPDQTPDSPLPPE